MTVFFPKFEELMVERFNNYTAVILFLLFFLVFEILRDLKKV